MATVCFGRESSFSLFLNFWHFYTFNDFSQLQHRLTLGTFPLSGRGIEMRILVENSELILGDRWAHPGGEICRQARTPPPFPSCQSPCLLLLAMVAQMHTFVKTYQIPLLKSEQLITYQLYLDTLLEAMRWLGYQQYASMSLLKNHMKSCFSEC